jgi:hypothetical protein
MRFVLRFGVAALGAGLALVGCQQGNESRYPGLTDCTTDCGGGPPPTGSFPDAGVGGSSSGGTGGAAATIDQAGTVHRILDPGFSDKGTAFTGTAIIVAYPDQGAQATQPYGGTAGTTFTFPAIPAVPTWFFVQDTSSGAAGVLSTFSRFSLPVAAGLALPVIDLGTLQIIAMSLPTVVTIGAGAQIILFVTQGSVPLKGVKVTSGAGNGQLAYDIGPSYTDTAGAATGTGGVILVLNSGLSGKQTLTLTDTATLKTYDVEVEAAQGAATLVGYELK